MTALTDPWEDPRILSGLATQLQTQRGLLASGARRIGWKVGFGAPASLEMMQIPAPLLGFLTDRTALASGAVVDASTWDYAVVEFEVAVYMGRDVGPDTTLAEAAGAVAAVGSAIELANVDLPVGPKAVTDIVARNIFHSGLILGQPDDARAGLDITGLVASIVIDGVETARITDLQALTGLYPEIVSTVAKTLDAAGDRLRAGDVIITGSVVPPISADQGQAFAFTLDPLGTISVNVTS